MLSSAYLGNNPNTVKSFEAWIGREVDFVRAHTGEANWSDYVTSVDWVGSQLSKAGRPLVWTVPMFPHGGNMKDAAAGAYNHHYAKIAQSVVARSGGQDEIIMRFGEEFNGSWMPWAAKGREAEYIATFRHMADAFRSASDKFRLEWNVNIGEGMDPAKAYPGDRYVDIISMDFYYDTRWDSKDPIAAWNHFVDRPWGLQWLEDFAEARGKPTAYSEWGVDHDGAGPFIRKAFEWFQDHDVVYQSYWNSNQDFKGALDLGTRPKAAAEFVKQMRAEADADGPAKAPPAKPSPQPAPEEAPKGAPEPEPEPAPERGPEPDASSEAPPAALLKAIAALPPPASGASKTWKAGTAGPDRLVGDDRNNHLNGLDGQDRTVGGRGDDTHVVEQTRDAVVEKASQGIDTVQSWAERYTLPQHVENLTLLKASGIRGTGNALDNRITGGKGDDVIDGAGGSDWLTGGLGHDTFVFRGRGGRDTVTDFDAGAGRGDVIHLVGTALRGFEDAREAAVQIGDDTAILVGSTDSILLLGVARDELARDDFLFS